MIDLLLYGTSAQKGYQCQEKLLNKIWSRSVDRYSCVWRLASLTTHLIIYSCIALANYISSIGQNHQEDIARHIQLYRKPQKKNLQNNDTFMNLLCLRPHSSRCCPLILWYRRRFSWHSDSELCNTHQLTLVKYFNRTTCRYLDILCRW